MNVLLVDDQQTVIESLKKGIRWQDLAVTHVYTANSAKEARMILKNFEIDILITDIEMPEEDGLSLFQWTRTNTPNVEGVFLTSHAEFDYAHKAIHMGGFDYVLQPVRCEDVENVLKKAWEKIKNEKKIRLIESTKKLIQNQKNNILDGLLLKISLGKENAANELYKSFPDIFQLEMEEPVVYPLLVEIHLWKNHSEALDENYIRIVFCNVIEELFADAHGNIAVSSLCKNRYLILLVLEKRKASSILYRQRIEEFYNFIKMNMNCQIGVYIAGQIESQDFSDVFEKLNTRADKNTVKKSGVFLNDTVKIMQDTDEDIISLAIRYIAKNLNKNLSRADVAEQVHLNEEYFSKLFKQKTGYTFKDYILTEKMEMAKKLLKESNFSVSLIASKVGFDNFSHFSKMFKKITDKTPQEFRKEKS